MMIVSVQFLAVAAVPDALDDSDDDDDDDDGVALEHH
jgi:hypothetical protein